MNRRQFIKYLTGGIGAATVAPKLLAKESDPTIECLKEAQRVLSRQPTPYIEPYTEMRSGIFGDGKWHAIVKTYDRNNSCVTYLDGKRLYSHEIDKLGSQNIFSYARWNRRLSDEEILKCTNDELFTPVESLT